MNIKNLTVLVVSIFVLLCTSCQEIPGTTPTEPSIPTTTSSVLNIYFNNGVITDTAITHTKYDNTTEILEPSALDGQSVSNITVASITSLGLNATIPVTVNLIDSDKSTNEELSFVTALKTSFTGTKFSLTVDATQIVTLKSPINADRQNHSDGDYVLNPQISNSFIFTARDLSGTPFINAGTEVFYRIYANQVDLQIDSERINDSNDENTNSGFRQLDSLGYKKMESTAGGQAPLISSDGGSVVITLSNTNSESAGIIPSGTVPQRWDNSYFNFDPDNVRNRDEYALATYGDADFESASSTDYQYVNAYAVSTGLDPTSYTPVQSELLSLGFLYYDVK